MPPVSAIWMSVCPPVAVVVVRNQQASVNGGAATAGTGSSTYCVVPLNPRAACGRNGWGSWSGIAVGGASADGAAASAGGRPGSGAGPAR